MQAGQKDLEAGDACVHERRLKIPVNTNRYTNAVSRKAIEATTKGFFLGGGLLGSAVEEPILMTYKATSVAILAASLLWVSLWRNKS